MRTLVTRMTLIIGKIGRRFLTDLRAFSARFVGLILLFLKNDQQYLLNIVLFV
jgi:hypothetical protein